MPEVVPLSDPREQALNVAILSFAAPRSPAKTQTRLPNIREEKLLRHLGAWSVEPLQPTARASGQDESRFFTGGSVDSASTRMPQWIAVGR